MAMVEPVQHTESSSTWETVKSTVAGLLKGPFEGAGKGALVGAVILGGLAAAVLAPLGATAAIVAGGLAALGGAAAGGAVGGVIGVPVGAAKGYADGRDKVRSENLEANLLKAREAGFQAQQHTAQALQMQVAQEVMASQPRSQLRVAGEHGGHHYDGKMQQLGLQQQMGR
jgi:hypothetical protein